MSLVNIKLIMEEFTDSRFTYSLLVHLFEICYIKNVGTFVNKFKKKCSRLRQSISILYSYVIATSSES